MVLVAAESHRKGAKVAKGNSQENSAGKNQGGKNLGNPPDGRFSSVKAWGPKWGFIEVPSAMRAIVLARRPTSDLCIH